MTQRHTSVLSFISLLFVMLLSSTEIHAQCKAFVKISCVPQLTPYIHDGGYQAVIMSEGEEAEIYKTIFAGQKYRLFVCIENTLPNVEFVVTDIRRNTLFDNRKNGGVKMWDFKPEASQQIKVTIRIPKSQKQGSGNQELIFGCVGILFGMLEQ